MSEPTFLSVRDAALRVGVSASLVYQWCAEGTLPHYRLGGSGRRGKIVIDPAELDKLFADSRVSGGGAGTEPLRHIRTNRDS